MKQLISPQAEKKHKPYFLFNCRNKNMVELVIERQKIPVQANTAVLLPDILLATNVISLSPSADPYLTR